jgi:hypothetical protein
MPSYDAVSFRTRPDVADAVGKHSLSHHRGRRPVQPEFGDQDRDVHGQGGDCVEDGPSVEEEDDAGARDNRRSDGCRGRQRGKEPGSCSEPATSVRPAQFSRHQACRKLNSPLAQPGMCTRQEGEPHSFFRVPKHLGSSSLFGPNYYIQCKSYKKAGREPKFGYMINITKGM